MTDPSEVMLFGSRRSVLKSGKGDGLLIKPLGVLKSSKCFQYTLVLGGMAR